MANCLLDLFRCLWAFILGSLRMILFFGCLIMLLFHLAGLIVVINRSEAIEELPHQEPVVGDFLVHIVTIAAYALGCWAAFYKHQPSLKTFVIIIFFCTAFQTLQLLNHIWSNNQDKKSADTFSVMSKYMKDFDWDASYGSGNKATRSWNTMQRLFCCGVNGPDDWDKYRPSSMKSNRLPDSCCIPLQGMSCTRGEAFDTGCQQRWDQIQMVSVLVYAFYIIFQGLLFFIGLVSLSPSDGCFSPRTRAAAAPEDGQQQQVLPNQYQKLEQSVYVRQPAYNPVSGDTKFGPGGGAYPDLTQPGYQPPPSYGARA